MSVKKNLIYNIVYQILLLLLPLITTPYISRVIGAEGVGTYSYTYSIANYFVIIAMLGINNYGNRTIARVRDDKDKLKETFNSLLVFHIIISSIMILLYIAYVVLFIKENKVIFVIQLLYVISAVFDINWFFFGLEQFKLTVTRNTIIKLISVISIFIFVKNKNDLWIYALILASSMLISQCLLWPFVKKFVEFEKPKLEQVKSHLRPCCILFIPVIAVSIYKVMDKIMLGSMSSMTQVGFYENSEKIINIPLGIITALGTVMLPKMSNLKSKGTENESKKYISMSMQFAMIIAIGSIFGLIGIGKNLIPIFLGDEFIECINIVAFLSITILFISWANVIRTQYIIPNRLDKIHVVSTSLGAIVNLIINLLLIKRFGAVGASIGTIFAEFSVAAYVTFKVRNELPIKQYIKVNTPFFITGIIMYISINIMNCFYEDSTIFGVLCKVIVGGVIYIGINSIYLIRSKTEMGLYLSNRFEVFLRKGKSI